MLHNKNKEEINEQNKSMYDVLNEAKNKNKQIIEMESKVDSQELRNNIREIGETVSKMISFSFSRSDATSTPYMPRFP